VRKEALRLLIVDDEEAARYGMRRALTTFGYNITEAGSAEAARAWQSRRLKRVHTTTYQSPLNSMTSGSLLRTPLKLFN
jgi:CheY-like chemotaxis protein